MYEQFKGFTDNHRLDFHQLVALASFGRALRAEYESLQLDPPDWLDKQLKAIRKDIQTRHADHIETRLTELRAREKAMKPEAQKRADIKDEIRKLTKLREGL